MKNTRDFIEQNDCDYAETTSGSNGYPENLNVAIVSDSFKELQKLKEQAEQDGFDCEFIRIHKRDGWACGIVKGVNLIIHGVKL